MMTWTNYLTIITYTYLWITSNWIIYQFINTTVIQFESLLSQTKIILWEKVLRNKKNFCRVNLTPQWNYKLRTFYVNILLWSRFCESPHKMLFVAISYFSQFKEISEIYHNISFFTWMCLQWHLNCMSRGRKLPIGLFFL